MGLTYEKDGALWFKSTEYGDDKDRVLRKSDGTLSYLTPDIANHIYKIERGYDHLINLWGADHHSYVTRMQLSLIHIFQLTLPAVLDHMFFYIVIFLGLLILEILISSNVWEKSARKLFKDKLTMIKDTIRQRRELKQLIKSGHIQQIEANMGNWRTDLLLRWNAVYVPVSYTHLDVYKRQELVHCSKGSFNNRFRSEGK